MQAHLHIYICPLDSILIIVSDKQLIAQDSHAKSQTKRRALPAPIRGAQTGWVGRGRESNWMSPSVSKWVDFLDSPRSTRTRPIHTFVNAMFTIVYLFTDGALCGGVGRIILVWYTHLKWNQYKRSTAKCSWYSWFWRWSPAEPLCNSTGARPRQGGKRRRWWERKGHCLSTCD